MRDAARRCAVWVLLLAALPLVACAPQRPPAAAVPDTTTGTLLDHLPVAPPDPAAGTYARVADFGRAWSYDANHNGCVSSREDVLRRDLVDVRSRTRCVVESGTLADPYTGNAIRFDRAHAAAVQIDHVYPLGLAWRHGAAGWTSHRRLEFANDLDNLLAVYGPTNEAKGDDGPGDWLPPNRREWCDYGTRFVRVAAKYGLSVTAKDRDALAGALATCTQP